MSTTPVRDTVSALAVALHQQRLQKSMIMQTALAHLMSMTDAPHGWVVLFGANGDLADAYSSGDISGALTRTLWNKLLLQDLISQIRGEGRLVLWGALHTHERWEQVGHAALMQPGSAVGLPLYVDDQMIGAIILLHPQPQPFNDDLCAQLEDAGSVIAHALANAQQYEQLAAAYQTYTEADKLRHDLAAMIYHDLRGPLQNIVTSITRVERLLEGSPVGTHFLAIAERSAQQMTRMIKSLLDVERLEANALPLRVQMVDLQDLLLEAADSVHSLAQEADQALILQVDEGLPCVQADRDMVLRVVINLLENAVKHTPEGGRISLRAMQGDHGIYVSVQDSGSGIPKTMQNDIFDKFVRLKRDSKREGYGLGLAFCRLAVEAHGGRIWVESDPHGGAVFAFVLPAMETARV
jgi:signal transduction histidine kinase